MKCIGNFLGYLIASIYMEFFGEINVLFYCYEAVYLSIIMIIMHI